LVIVPVMAPARSDARNAATSPTSARLGARRSIVICASPPTICRWPSTSSANAACVTGDLVTEVSGERYQREPGSGRAGQVVLLASAAEMAQ
jgi:hypothetical protein